MLSRRCIHCHPPRSLPWPFLAQPSTSDRHAGLAHSVADLLTKPASPSPPCVLDFATAGAGPQRAATHAAEQHAVPWHPASFRCPAGAAAWHIDGPRAQHHRTNTSHREQPSRRTGAELTAHTCARGLPCCVDYKHERGCVSEKKGLV